MRLSSRSSFLSLTLSVTSSVACVLACNSGSSDGEDATDSTMTESNGDGDPGDGDPGDGDPGDGDPGDGDPGDGDGDPPDECPPPDPPLAETLDGTWADQPEPTAGFDCTLAEGDGPGWNLGVLASTSTSSIDHVVVGEDDNVYAGGSITEGDVAALVIGAQLGNGPNGVSAWARSWTYDGAGWPVRWMAGTSNGRLWLNLAPEHLLAVGYDGAILDGPIEALTPGMAYIDGLGRGDDSLLAANNGRPMPPACIGNTRAQIRDQGDGSVVLNADATFSVAIFGLAGDGAGGVWLMTHDLNGAGATLHHYDAAGDEIGSFGVTNADGAVFGGALQTTSDGEVLIALRGPFIVDVRRFDVDGNAQWELTLPPLGNQEYGYDPQLALDDADNAYLGYTVGSGMGLAGVSAGGTVDWAGRWTCGDAIEVRGLDVTGDGQAVWVGGVQADTTGWLANFN